MLLTRCTTAECDGERTYGGTFIGGAEVMMHPEHKWHNAPYLAHAAVENYLPYALGGGYLLSLDVIRVRASRRRLPRQRRPRRDPRCMRAGVGRPGCTGSRSPPQPEVPEPH